MKTLRPMVAALALFSAVSLSACGGPETTVVERADGTSSAYGESGGLDHHTWGREECWADGGVFFDRGRRHSDWCLVLPPADYEAPVVLSDGRAESEVLRRVGAMDETQLADLLDYIKGRDDDGSIGNE